MTPPTLYLLHGMGGNAHTWVTNGGVDEAPGVGHVWPLWRQMVGDVLQLLFKPAAR